MLKYYSRRSPVYGTRCMVATSQPLASEIGLSILKDGGNAIDSAIAIAAALNVTEPCSTGIGGDAFLLYYNKSNDRIYALNGSGRSSKRLPLETAKLVGQKTASGFALPPDHPYCVTVPGAVACWADAVECWGTKSLEELLRPAINLAKQGFPVGPITCEQWKALVHQLRGAGKMDLLIDGKAPEAGEIFKNEMLAKVLKNIAAEGKKGFYSDWPAESICHAVQELGGCLCMDDMRDHQSTFQDPISVKYREYEVYEVAPNGQGIATLMALNMLEGLDIATFEHNSVSYLHTLIELMRIAFADVRYYVADTSVAAVPIEEMLSKKYAEERRKLLDPSIAKVDVKKGSPFSSSDTVSFQVVDSYGNAVSMVNSNYQGFGSGIVPANCGFSLQNRGANFSLVDGDPNVLAPGKRPFHTIIPAMVRRNGNFYATFTVMGGFMQPQGQFQVFCNLAEFNMDPQSALDSPRFCIFDGEANGEIAFEEGIDEDVVDELRRMGHRILQPAKLPYDIQNKNAVIVTGVAREIFGRGQIITLNPANGVLCGGSDGRADGCVMGC